MSKSTMICLFALAATISISGCSKEQPSSAANTSQAQPEAAQPNMPHPRPAAPSEGFDLSDIAKAEGGNTVAEIFADKEQFAGQPVIVRGMVVKANAGIMGRNWLHIRDGSGVEGSNDLTVTTLDVVPNVGDTVLVAGIIEVNKDFGMGYQYDVIIEDAEVTVESAPGY